VNDLDGDGGVHLHPAVISFCVEDKNSGDQCSVADDGNFNLLEEILTGVPGSPLVGTL
jgi:hypothetical protein